MNFDETIPIYKQIMDYIKADIVNGRLNLGDKLLSVRDLSKDLKVNPNTVQRAYQELEREGVLFKRRGMGSFITEDEKLLEEIRYETARLRVTDFIEEMEKLGFERKELGHLLDKFILKEDPDDSRD